MSMELFEKARKFWTNYSFVISFLVVSSIAIIKTDDFLSSQNLINILYQVSTIGIISLGMSMVIISGGIDLSVGAVLAFTGTVILYTLNKTENILLAIIAGIATGAIIGLINGFFIARTKIAPFIVTLSAMTIFRSLTQYINNSGSITGKIKEFQLISNSSYAGIPFPVYIFFLLTFLIILIMVWTPFGRYIYAIGSNEKAANLSAIPVIGIKISVYIVCGVLTAIASVIESSRLSSISSTSSGVNYELEAIAAAVIGGISMTGGRGLIIGTFVGVLIIGILNNLINLANIQAELQGMLKGIIILLAVLIQKRDKN